jgi:cytochrome P450
MEREMTKEEAWNEYFKNHLNGGHQTTPSTSAWLVDILLCDMPDWKIWIEGPDGKPMPVRSLYLMGKDGIMLKHSEIERDK